MLINLKKTQKELWEQIGGLRTDIRKGEKNNIEIITTPTTQDLEEAYQLYLTMMKDNFLPVLKSYSLSPGENRKIIVAKKEGRVISYISYQLSSALDTLQNTKICALETIATDTSSLSFGVNPFLYWEGIIYIKSLGYEYLNFNGVWYQYGESQFASLTKFKRKWSGLEIPLYSERTIVGYLYWRFFRKYKWIQKISYMILTTFFSGTYKKY